MKEKDFIKLVEIIQNNICTELEIKVQFKVVSDGGHLMVYVTTLVDPTMYPILRVTNFNWDEACSYLIHGLIFNQQYEVDGEPGSLLALCEHIYIK